MKSQLVYLILLIVLAQSQAPTAQEIEEFQKEAQKRIKEFNEQAAQRQKEIEASQEENNQFSDVYPNVGKEYKGPNRRLLPGEENTEPAVKYVEVHGKYSAEIPLPVDKTYEHNGANMLNEIPPHMIKEDQEQQQNTEQINKKNTRPHRLFQEEEEWISSDPDEDIQLKQKLMVLGMEAISKKYNPIQNGANFNGIGDMEELMIDDVNHFKIPYYFINSSDDVIEYQVIITEKLLIIGCELLREVYREP